MSKTWDWIKRYRGAVFAVCLLAVCMAFVLLYGNIFVSLGFVVGGISVGNLLMRLDDYE